MKSLCNIDKVLVFNMAQGYDSVPSEDVELTTEEVVLNNAAGGGTLTEVSQEKEGNVGSSSTSPPTSAAVPEDDTLPAYDGLEGDSSSHSAKLPSYEEYESNNTDSPYVFTSGNSDFTTLAEAYIPEYGLMLGSDATFCFSFLFSLIFASMPIVFFFIFCGSKTLAGRCGAMSGFGLGVCRFMFTFVPTHNNSIRLDKITANSSIHSTMDAHDMAHRHHHHGEVLNNSIMWFVVVWGTLCGWYCLIKGISTYLNAKRAIILAQMNEVERIDETGIDDMA